MQTAVVASRESLICCDSEAMCCRINARAFKKCCACRAAVVGSEGRRKAPSFCPCLQKEDIWGFLQMLPVCCCSSTFGYMLDKY